MISKLRQQAWDKALSEAGMGHVFRDRATDLSKSVRTTKVLGVLVPMIPGAIVLSYEVDGIAVQVSKWVFSVLSVFLAYRFGRSLALGHDDKLNYYYESASHHSSLAEAYTRVAQDDSLSEEDIRVRLADLNGEQRVRDQQDDKHNITAKDERKAMRYGLRQFGRKCEGCKEVPTSLSPSNCNICGNY